MKILVVLSLLTLCTFTAQEATQSTNRLDQHAWLQQFVGEWDVSSEIHEPDGTSTTFASAERVRAIGGLWIVVEGTADNDGEPFTSLMTLGYDPDEAAFVASWVDTLQPRMWTYVGQLDDAGRVLTLETEGPHLGDPKRTARYRDLVERVGPDHKRTTSFVLGEDGEWTQYLTVDARRRK